MVFRLWDKGVACHRAHCHCRNIVPESGPKTALLWKKEGGEGLLEAPGSPSERAPNHGVGTKELLPRFSFPGTMASNPGGPGGKGPPPSNQNRVLPTQVWTSYSTFKAIKTFCLMQVTPSMAAAATPMAGLAASINPGSDLASLFECPVCFDYVLPPILQVTLISCLMSTSSSHDIKYLFYRVIFLTGTPLKVLSVRLHSKSHQKSSKCQNFLTNKNLWFLGGSQLKKSPCMLHSSLRIPKYHEK